MFDDSRIEPEKTFESLVESLPVGIFYHDFKGTFLYGNKKSEEIIGYTRDELIGKNFFKLDILNLHDKAKAAKLIALNKLGKSTGPDQFKLKTKKGPEKVVNVHSSIITINNKNVVLGVVEDLTEKKLFENALQISRERYDLATQVAKFGVWDWEIDTNKFYLDPNIKSILGYSDEEIPNDLNIWANYIHPDDREEVMNAGNTLIEGDGNEYFAEHKMLHKDGSIRWIMARGQLIRDEKNKPLRMLGTDTDITERKLSEQALRESEERYRAVVEQSNEAIYLVNVDTRRIMDVNPAMEKLLGYTKDELHLMKLYDFLDHTPEDIDKKIELILSQRETYLGERRYRHKNGSKIDVDVSVNLIHYQKTNAMCVVARDITDRKRAEEERKLIDQRMQEAQKLESLGILAGGIAHDFNNLLSGVIGNASLAQLKLDTASPIQQLLKRIEKSGHRAAELSKQLLAYSGNGQFVVQSINLTQLVEEMTDLLKTSISKKAIVSFNFADNLPAIEADVTEIRQVIMNLIINASESLEKGKGELKIATGLINAEKEHLSKLILGEDLDPGSYVFYMVQDTGCGMDENSLKKIFDPYYSNKIAGRGLGLASVLGIVRGHKGAIDVQSTPGKGTTFKVLFQVSKNEYEDVVEDISQREIPEKNGTVLVVEDEETVRNMAAHMLEELGYKVVIANHGLHGVELLQKYLDKINLVLLDLTMPEMGGAESLYELCKIKKDLKVILTSGYGESQYSEILNDDHIVGFLQKPYNFNKLIDVISGVNEH